MKATRRVRAQDHPLRRFKNDLRSDPCPYRTRKVPVPTIRTPTEPPTMLESKASRRCRTRARSTPSCSARPTPGVPGVPGAPGVPSVPCVPSVPSIPGRPGAPSVPSVPIVPGIPRVPSVPSVITSSEQRGRARRWKITSCREPQSKTIEGSGMLLPQQVWRGTPSHTKCAGPSGMGGTSAALVA